MRVLALAAVLLWSLAAPAAAQQVTFQPAKAPPGAAVAVSAAGLHEGTVLYLVPDVPVVLANVRGPDPAISVPIGVVDDDGGTLVVPAIASGDYRVYAQCRTCATPTFDHVGAFQVVAVLPTSPRGWGLLIAIAAVVVLGWMALQQARVARARQRW